MRNRNLALLAIVVVSSLVLASCAAVTSDMPTAKNATGEAWYVKTFSLFGLPLALATQVFYCPAPASAKDDFAVCRKAEMLDEYKAASVAESSSVVQQKDTSPPRIVDVQVKGGLVIGVAEDTFSNISSVQFMVDGKQPWIQVRPKHGVYNAQREELDFPVPSSFAPGKHHLTIQVFDAAYNPTTAEVEVNVLAAPPDTEPAPDGE